MKTHFIFHREYYDIFISLEFPKNVTFMLSLCECMLKDGNSSEHIKEVSFDDKELNEAWDKIISFKQKRGRNSPEYKLWRSEVFERDNYTCQKCYCVGRKLNAHHIKKWSTHIELRFEISNGITLCEKCHREVHHEKVI